DAQNEPLKNLPNSPPARLFAMPPEYIALEARLEAWLNLSHRENARMGFSNLTTLTIASASQSAGCAYNANQKNRLSVAFCDGAPDSTLPDRSVQVLGENRAEEVDEETGYRGYVGQWIDSWSKGIDCRLTYAEAEKEEESDGMGTQTPAQVTSARLL
ncbi:MAG: hypothetical protein Q9173_002300, partial [Seirophora scorigena]